MGPSEIGALSRYDAVLGAAQGAPSPQSSPEMGEEVSPAPLSHALGCAPLQRDGIAAGFRPWHRPGCGGGWSR